MNLVEHLATLLEYERTAAIEADVEQLLVLQAQKRELLKELKQAQIDLPASLTQKAQTNLDLLKHLQNVLAALIGTPSMVYGKSGSVQGHSVMPRVIRNA